ncbi:nucleolar complex protein 3 homolog [Scaptodrosophila lebanonensis]|uniref:Nucleolar complex protein 3 homolog n=1 Tax=Drosophila lebanonensis TaxID=7225 RepID=A0A6J2TD03_DROLE|nr:nucleolar complex protein 3 homolog [Scaptodrosophila lebanonensis]
MGTKKVKISSVKRAAHLKAKKTPLTKQQQQKVKQKQEQLRSKREQGQNIFSQKAHKRDNLAQRKKRNKQASLGQLNVSDDDEDGVGDGDMLDNVADMLDGDDLALLQERNKRKRKAQPEEQQLQQHSVGLEMEYRSASKKELAAKKVKVDLLPIKSRDGEIITRTTEVDYVPKPKQRKAVQDKNEEAEDDDSGVSVYEDSDDDVVNDAEAAESAPKARMISTADLMIARQQEIERQKYRIGIICSGILEKPEDKMRNLNALYELMDEVNTTTGLPNLITVRRLAIISVTEIFKDILPEYRVGQVDTKMQTVRKATLERVTYENAMLQQFKKFLQKLEFLTATVTKRGGQRTPKAIIMAAVAVDSMCEILAAHPYFNYVQNIAQLLVYMLNCNYANMRASVHKCFRTLFSTDKKLDMSLFVVRRINHLIKTKENNVHLECITCLMGLKIKNVNLDAEKENELKQKKLESHRQRLLSLSKKERKRRKKLTELNKELDETRAEENKQTKHHKLTEIIKMVFTIYFRVLKNDPTSRVLSAILEGLAEFAHVINLEFFSDLIDVLNRILEEQEEELGYREQLHCIQTIFVILSGQGEVLNIDPIRFYQHFYRNMLVVNAGKNHADFSIILRTMDEVLVKRRRNMSQQRLMAFVKRLLTGSLHLLHHGTLASLATIKQTFQLTSVLDALLDTDASYGSGRYDPELEDPEYCNAASTSLYELALLARHYHPTVRRMAAHIANGVPASGEGALPTEIGKLTAHELFEQYDSTQMVFNPSIPLPNKCEPKLKKGRRMFIRENFRKHYQQVLQREVEGRSSQKLLQFDFLSELNKQTL